MVLHTTEYYSAVGKKERMPLAATGAGPERYILSEVRQKDRYHRIWLPSY